MQNQNYQPNRTFDSELFLIAKQRSRKFFFAERMNFGSIPTVVDMMNHLRSIYSEKEMPTIATVARWHSSWKRSN